jgi:hypothetical protein
MPAVQATRQRKKGHKSANINNERSCFIEFPIGIGRCSRRSSVAGCGRATSSYVCAQGTYRRACVVLQTQAQCGRFLCRNLVHGPVCARNRAARVT